MTKPNITGTPSTPPSPPKRRRWRFAVIALLMSGVVALALIEIVFRLFVPVTDVAFQFWDPVVGLRRLPDQRGVNISGRSIRARYNYNAQGWNYPEDFLFTRPAQTLRLCMVGDSYVEAQQVDCDKHMAVMIEKRLSKPGRPVQCYPFGCSGYGTTHEYQIIHHYVLDYQPNVVIIFFTANDVYDCSPYLGPLDSFFARYRLSDTGELERMPMTYWERSPFRRWSARFALARYVLIQKGLLQGFRTPGPAGVTLREISSDASVEDCPAVGLSQDERGRKSWALIERLFAAAKADCLSRGATLLIAYRGNLPEIEAAEAGVPFTPVPKEKDPYCLNERVCDMGRDFVAPIAARLGIPYLDLTEPLMDHIRKTGQPHNFPDDLHFNETGHAVAAEAMAGLVQRVLDRRAVGGDVSSDWPSIPAKESTR